MVARNEADWETRLWHLTHDLVVRVSLENGDAGVSPQATAVECLELAVAVVATYRAAVEQRMEGL